MTVAVYERFLARAAQWGFDSARLRQHLRTAFAACIAVLAAWALGLEHPQWAGMTVWAASQPLRGQFAMPQAVIGQKAGQVVVKFLRRSHRTRGTQARQQRVGAGGNQGGACGGIDRAGLNFCCHGLV